MLYGLLVILIVPTLNDSADEIKGMSEWVVKHLGPDVPMHFTRFHPTYRLTNLPATPIATPSTIPASPPVRLKR